MEVGDRPDRRLRVVDGDGLVEGGTQCGDLLEFGDATALDDVRLDDVRMPLQDQVTELPPLVLLFARAMGMSTASATCAIPA